ncbi:hypothetical protein [Streptomyces sp. DSM 15324]|uniref:hypothetical protein n=1 Tax=Streptomyces sp. DSM 15324 TaxID=1739111 RepID=UPI000749BC21|nr:hypothetical protein [Streptomyces sp. DSM 15324]KUO09241.1 hypothetical protein AQJ58_24790 [Streptomyces sp. DSM 15324]
MTDGSGKITEEQVQEKAAQFRALLERRTNEGPEAWAHLNVEAAARRALEAQGRRQTDPRAVLQAIRPTWETEAAQKGLTGKELHAFARQILEEDGPEIQAEMDGFYYTFHLNQMAVAMVVGGASAAKDLLEDAAEEFWELAAIFMALYGAIEAETQAISAAAAQGNGQVKLDGVFPDPFVIPSPDSDYVFEVHNVLGGLLGDLQDQLGG